MHKCRLYVKKYTTTYFYHHLTIFNFFCMKKHYKNHLQPLFTLLLVAVSAVAAFAQGGVFINSPASLVGPRSFGTARWLNVNAMTNTICSDLVLAGGLGNNDSLAGPAVTAAAPNGIAFTNAAAVNGKIVIIYRGTFAFVDKLANAIASGATAIIFVQRDNTPPLDDFGAAATVNIPAVMISKADGDALLAAMRTGATINACLGRTTLQNDLKVTTFAPIYSAFPREMISSLTVANTDSLFNLAGGEVYNLALAQQLNIAVTTTVTNTSTGYVAFDKTYAGGDTCSVVNTPNDTLIITNGGVSLKDYGVYNFTSTVSATANDQFTANNMNTATLRVNDYYISKVPVNPNTYQPVASAAYTLSTTAEPHPGFEAGFVFDVNGDGFVIDTVKFAAAGQVDLSGKRVSVALYTVLDADGTGAVETDPERELVCVKDYTFPALTGAAKTGINAAALGFTAADGADLVSGSRYLITITAPSTPGTDKVFLGYNPTTDYEGVLTAFFGNPSLKAFTPYNTYLYNIGAGTHSRSGFGFDLSPAMSVRVKNTLVPVATQREMLNNKVGVSPNPTSGVVRIDLSQFNDNPSSIVITNMLGAVVVNLTNQKGIVPIDMNAQASGMYNIVVTNAEGQAVKKLSLMK